MFILQHYETISFRKKVLLSIINISNPKSLSFGGPSTPCCCLFKSLFTRKFSLYNQTFPIPSLSPSMVPVPPCYCLCKYFITGLENMSLAATVLKATSVNRWLSKHKVKKTTHMLPVNSWLTVGCWNEASFHFFLYFHEHPRLHQRIGLSATGEASAKQISCRCNALCTEYLSRHDASLGKTELNRTFHIYSQWKLIQQVDRETSTTKW